MKIAMFDLFELEMWGNATDGWEENNRFNLGHLEVPCDDNGEFSKRDILKAMKQKDIKPLFGIPYKAISTIDKRVVFIEEVADGWYEIGLVRGREPVYGLRLIEEVPA